MQEQSFATGRISIPLALSGETPNITEYDFLDNGKVVWNRNQLDFAFLHFLHFPNQKEIDHCTYGDNGPQLTNILPGWRDGSLKDVSAYQKLKP